MKFEGIYTPAITPLDVDGAIDRKAFAAVLEHLIASKVHGIIIAGSTGEYYAHTMQERIDLAAYAKEVIGSRLPLIVGTGAIRTEESVAYARQRQAFGRRIGDFQGVAFPIADMHAGITAARLVLHDAANRDETSTKGVR